MAGTVLPVSVGAVGGWQWVDFLNLRVMSQPATGGRAWIDCGQLDPAELWLIDHAVVACGGESAASVRWYEDAEDPLRLLDGSDAGNFGVAEWPSGLQIRPSTSLLVVWSNVDDGAVGSLALQGRKMRRA